MGLASFPFTLARLGLTFVDLSLEGPVAFVVLQLASVRARKVNLRLLHANGKQIKQKNTVRCYRPFIVLYYCGTYIPVKRQKLEMTP